MTAYRHPDTGDTWNLQPDADGMLQLDARVAGLLLSAAGYQPVPDPDLAEEMAMWNDDPAAAARWTD